MEFEIHDICGKFKELTIKDTNIRIESGTLDKEEAKELARSLISAAEELLS